MPSAFSQPSQDSPSKFTRVDGIGLWNSWTRNFKTPLLALLDLLDNAFDAALVDPQDVLNGISDEDFRGKLHITPDQHLDQNDVTTGVTITNNCACMTKPLKNILEVYSSSKGKATESIGENGVGLKQGCATLSDLSFVFMRNKQELSLGVLARDLQKPEGCILPSFVFASYETDELQREMEYKFRNEDIEVGECVKKYGGGDLRAGINRLLLNFAILKDKSEDMGGWGNDEHVFSIVLHEVRHGNAMHRTSQNVTDNTPHYDPEEGPLANVWQVEYAKRAKNLMNTLYEELPRHYIHIPLTFDVRVNAMPVQFFYWQRRLAELTVFYPRIDTQTLWHANADWLKSGYPIRVFAGFDPVRCGMEGAKKALTLYVYSRRSGRLIKHEYDARAMLGLSNGGTNFCQGLTIIVDDCQGKLPLSPTKQDIAFGEEAHGDIHKENLYSWIGGIVNCYFNHHLLKFDKKKAPLTDAVKRLLPEVRAQGTGESRLLATLNLTYFADVHWVGYQKRIRNRRGYSVIEGSDTTWRIEEPKIIKKKPKVTPRNSLDAPETVEPPTPVTSSQLIDADDDLGGDNFEGMTPDKITSKKRNNEIASAVDDWEEIPRKKRSRKAVSYNEFDDSDDEERRRKKRKKKKKKKDKKRRHESSENAESTNVHSDDESKDDSEADDMENELLDNVSDAVDAAVATVLKPPASSEKAMEPDQVGSMAPISSSTAEKSSTANATSSELMMENKKLNLRLKKLVQKVSDKNLEVTKLKEDLQQLKAQREVDQQKIEEELKKVGKVNKNLKQILNLEKKEKESLQRENEHLKQRERTNEQMVREEGERVKLLQSKLQYYQSLQESISDGDQVVSDNVNSGVSNSNQDDDKEENDMNGTTAQGTSLRTLFAETSANGSAPVNGGADGESSLGSFPYEDF